MSGALRFNMTEYPSLFLFPEKPIEDFPSLMANALPGHTLPPGTLMIQPLYPATFTVDVSCTYCTHKLEFWPGYGHKECQRCFPCQEPPEKCVYFQLTVKNASPDSYELVRCDRARRTYELMHDGLMYNQANK